jgi:hypothetical protein
MTPRFVLAAAFSATLLPVPPCAGQDPGASAAWTAFTKLPAARQRDALDAFANALPEHPIVAQVRAAAAAIDRPGRARPRAEQRARRTIEFAAEPDVLCRRVEYLFGTGLIAPRGRMPAAGRKSGWKGANRNSPPDATPLRQALQGCVPDGDRALAGLLQRLDADPRADTFAAFLQSWRNEDESFYEALDRTAGTEQSVFFFDVMLDDFHAQFSGAGHGVSLGSGKQREHDALHDAFLAYRQYRGFREAVAFSLMPCWSTNRRSLSLPFRVPRRT